MADDKMLHIPDSLGRDLDNGKCDNMPMENFMSPAQLEQIEAATADYNATSRAPVRGEDLIPISKAEAARRTAFDGQHLPKAPATRRVIPKPYQRDRVTGGRHGKTWGEIEAVRIRPGDIITEVGLVRELFDRVRHEGEPGKHVHEGDGTVEGCPGCFPVATGTDIVVVGISGKVRVYDVAELVKVFRKH